MPCRRVWSYAVWEESGLEMHYDIRLQLFYADKHSLHYVIMQLFIICGTGIGLSTHLHGVPYSYYKTLSQCGLELKHACFHSRELAVSQHRSIIIIYNHDRLALYLW